MKEKYSLDLYRVFCAVYECRSFSEAARRLYITQSAVSQSVKQLEVSLGVELFVRGKRNATPSTEGEELYRTISPALETIGEAEGKIERLRLLEEGTLCIGVADTVAKGYLLPYLKRWSEKYPSVHLKFTNRTSTEAFSLLSAGKIDVAFVNSPVPDDKFSVKKCMDLHDVFVAGCRFSSLKNRTVTLGELQNYPLIMLERLSNMRKSVDEYFAMRGILPAPDIELGSHALLVDFAKINLGISCVTREFCEMGDGLFELHLSEPLPTRELDLCYLESGKLSGAKKAFIAMFS